MSNGFDRDRRRKQRKLNNNKTQKGNFHLRFMLRVIFGFAEHKEKATFGLDYKPTFRRNTDNAVLYEENASNNAKIKIDVIACYVPLFIESVSQPAILSKQNLSNIPTEPQYVERSVFMNEVNTQKIWTFELGSEEE